MFLASFLIRRISHPEFLPKKKQKKITLFYPLPNEKQGSRTTLPHNVFYKNLRGWGKQNFHESVKPSPLATAARTLSCCCALLLFFLMVCSLLEARFQTARDADGAKRVTAGFSDRTKKKQQALLPAPPALLEFAEEGWPRFFILFYSFFFFILPLPSRTKHSAHRTPFHNTVLRTETRKSVSK